MADSRKTGKTGKGREPAPRPPADRPPIERPPRRTMPVWLQNTLIGLIIFTLTLGLGILIQYIICALALGVAVFQLWNRRGRLLWTGMCFLAVGLYLAGVMLALRYQPMWFLYFGAWIFVIVALVGEGSRAIRKPRDASSPAGRDEAPGP